MTNLQKYMIKKYPADVISKENLAIELLDDKFTSRHNVFTIKEACAIIENY